MSTPSVLVAGAGPAGLSVAVLLARRGFRVTVAERSSRVRATGYAVDLRGEALDVADELGVLPALLAHRTASGPTTVLATDGSVLDVLPAERFAGDLEVPKSALTAVLLDAALAEPGVEVLLGQAVSSVEQGPGGVRVGLADATVEADLLVGADGLWSSTRRLVFGDHGRWSRHLGLSGAGFTTGNWLGLRGEGRLTVGDGTAVYVLSGHDGHLMTVSLTFATADHRLDRASRADQEAAVAAAFAGHSLDADRLVARMRRADDFYFASSTQVVMPSWSSGRVVLLGDAAACAAPTSGAGTSQALLGARCLARALGAEHDHVHAFDGLERELRPVVERHQALGAAAAVELGARPRGGADRPSS